jgi:DNA-binding CsgD family transcriptional regulator
MPRVEVSAVLFGRDTETGLLAAMAARAAAGRGAAVLLEGEPGIGKSSLLDVVAQRCAELGMRVLHGGADGLEQLLPFSGVAACLGMRSAIVDPQVAPVAGLLRGERTSLAGWTQKGDGLSRGAAANHDFVVTEAVLDLMDRWCAQGPVLLMVDDAQWVDPQSAMVFNRLGRVVAELPLLMVLASRPVRTDAAAALWSGLTSRGAQTLRLGPLDKQAVADLVTSLVGASPGAQLRDMVAGASGNPLYVGELVTVLSREGLIEVAGGVADTTQSVGAAEGPGRIPQSLVDAILRRLDFLPREVRETLQMAAALGPDLDVSELSAVLDLSVMQLWNVVGTAMDAGLIVDDERSLVFRHDLIREALAGHLPAPVQTALHLRAGQVLTAAGAAVERVAEHVLASNEIDGRTIEWLLRAADTLIVRAPEVTVRLLQRAVSTVLNDETLFERLRFQLVRALLWAGYEAPAEQVARQVLAGEPDPDSARRVRWLLAQAFFRQGRLADAAAVAEESLNLPGLTVAESGRLQGFASLCYLFLGNYPASSATGAKAIAAAEASGDHIAGGYGYFTAAVVGSGRRRLVEALALADRAVAAIGAGIQPDLQVDPHFLRGFILLELNRLAEADEALATSIRHNEQSGGVVFLIVPHFSRTRLRFLDGRWDDMLAEIESTQDLGDPLGFAPLLYGLGTLVAVHRGTNRDSVDDLPTLDERFGSLARGYVLHWAYALVAEARCDRRYALDLLRRTWDDPHGLFPQRMRHFICADLARLALAEGDRELVQALATRTAQIAGEQPTHGLRGTALLCRGLVDDDPGPLLAAAEDYRVAGWPLYEGYAKEHAAVLLAVGGRLDEARDALDAALALYTGLDAAWDAARAEARLRAQGVRLGRRGHRKRPKTGWRALTVTEHKVARLVAEGKSNPDIAAQMFLSRRTVQTHVSSILRKLNVDSRVELAVSASRRTVG